MIELGPFIRNHLLSPLKELPTVISNTMLDIIIERLQTLYDYTVKFPEIITPGSSRLDILRTISDQFLFTVREDGDIQEQIDILDKIIYVYKKRGSIDTIENMWKYYGGDLPRDVQVIVPSYNLFRYSMSKLSGTHVYQDNETNRTGSYEIRLVNNTYPIPELKDFLLKELVAAGNYIYFTNTLHSDISEGDESTHPFHYTVVDKHYDIDLTIEALRVSQGFAWSGSHLLSDTDEPFSGHQDVYAELLAMSEVLLEDEYDISLYDNLGFLVTRAYPVGDIEYMENEYLLSSITSSSYYSEEIEPDVSIDTFTTTLLRYYTSGESSASIERYFIDAEGNPINSSYPGYFVLGETLLGDGVI